MVLTGHVARIAEIRSDYIINAVPLYAMEALGGRGSIGYTHS
jgi:hypothetical protein